jgi:hypothetical protein
VISGANKPAVVKFVFYMRIWPRMSLEIKRLSENFALVLLLQWILMLALDRMELRSRMRLLVGEKARPPLLWAGPGADVGFWRLYTAWLALRLIDDFYGPARKGPHSPYLVLEVVGFLAAMAGAIALLIAIRGWLLKRRSLENWRVSRGALSAALQRLTRSARVRRYYSFPIYVLPVENFAELCARMRRGVIIPRLLLDHMSKGEVNSVAARQIVRQSGHFYEPVFWIGLILNGSAVGVSWHLHLGGVALGLMCCCLAGIEIAVLRLSTSRLILSAEIKAIDLTGDPEAFFSAQRLLERFGGSEMSVPQLEAIAGSVGLSPKAIEDINASRSAPFSADRYLTAGSYLETGL